MRIEYPAGFRHVWMNLRTRPHDGRDAPPPPARSSRALAQTDPGRLPVRGATWWVYQPLPTVLAVVAIVVYALLVLGGPMNGPLRIAIDDLGSVLAALTAAALCLHTARTHTDLRAQRSWLLLGLGMLSWGTADAYWTWSELVLGVVPVTPSLADIGYLALVPLLFAGILLRPRLGQATEDRWQLLLDSCLTVTALLAVAWATVLGPIYARLETSLLVQAITLAYPLGDLAILACLLISVLRDTETRPATMPLLLGLATMAVGDAAYAALVASGTYATGHPVDVIWFAALVLVALAASVEHRERTVERVTKGGLAQMDSPWRFMLPSALLAVASLAVWTMSTRRGQLPIGPAEAALTVAWILLLVRVYLGYRAAAEGHRRERALRIGHTSVFRREQQRRRQLEAVRDVTTELTRELDLTALLSLITRRAAELVDAPLGAAFLWDPTREELVPRAWYGLGAWFEEIRIQRGEGAAGRAVELGRGVIVNDYATSRQGNRRLLSRQAVSAALAAPIVSGGKLVGAIVAADHQAGRAFDESHLSLMELFAHQAAVAIEHARLVDEASSVEALRELDRLKTELLSTVSHELRTPLTLIHGYAELLQVRARSLSPDEVDMMSDEILQGSRTMIRLVDDLLDFSRLDSTRLHLELAQMDLTAMLRRQVQGWRTQPGGDRLRLDLDGPLEAYADQTRVDQIVRNLITNALNHAPEGLIIVRGRQDGTSVRIEVQDHGHGIPADELPRIWESFFRGQQARNSPNRGSGLGLAVVRQLVELQHGRVDVESVVGEGTTFRVWLPTHPPADGATANPSPAASGLVY